MKSRHALAALARRLNRDAGAPGLPALYFFTDPERTPDLERSVSRLPHGTAVIYRHFGARERGRVARKLAAICRGRGLLLLISANAALAQRVGAHGVHWPEQRLDRARRYGLTTASAHSAEAIARAVAAGVDACVLGPVFETKSASGNRSLGLFRASQLARSAGVPVIALGGINTDTGPRLAGRGFAGLAAVEALA